LNKALIVQQTFPNVLKFQWSHPGPGLPIGYVGLSLGPQDQDQRGPPVNCGTHKVNCLYMISSINIGQNFVSSLFMKLSFIHLIRFRVDNQGCGVGGKISEFPKVPNPTPDSDFPKFPTSTP